MHFAIFFVERSVPVGTVIILAAGILSGIFVIPTVGVRDWDWEQIWMVYSISAFLLLPLCVTTVLFPNIFRQVLQPQRELAARVGAYGVLFGIGCVLFGVTWSRLGIAVANALVSGINILVGSIGPVVVGAVALDRRGWSRLIVGIVPLMIGLLLSAIACIARDRARTTEPGAVLSQSLLGIGFALASGTLSAMLNVGFSVGTPLQAKASSLGYPPHISTLAIWVPALAGGFVANFAYPAFLVQRRRKWGTLVGLPNSPELWSRSLMMGVLWSAAIFAYGYGAWIMGPGGTTYGWAIISGAGILGSLLLGGLMGEWKDSGVMPKVLVALSVVSMSLAFFVLSG